MKKLLLYISISVFLPLYVTANNCNYIMDDYQMEKIIESMRNQTEEVKQLNIIKMHLQRLCINTNQMLSLMQVFESKEIQKEFVIYSEKYITDIEEYEKLEIN